MHRNQFTFYDSFQRAIKNMRSNKAKLQAYQILCDYALDAIEPDLDAVSPDAATVFRIAQPILDAARRKAAAGQKGGLACAANMGLLGKLD